MNGLLKTQISAEGASLRKKREKIVCNYLSAKVLVKILEIFHFF